MFGKLTITSHSLKEKKARTKPAIVASFQGDEQTYKAFIFLLRFAVTDIRGGL
jgi:hypothetical protein